MGFRVLRTEQADRDLEQITDWYLTQEVGEAGLKWLDGLEKSITSLASLPFRCPLAREDKDFEAEIRQLLYGRAPHVYRILFTIPDNETVVILRVRHGRQLAMVPPQ
ncbi:type II toxin-antitoxin system RelE/ParE family toxin [Silvibacterium acidisoli]|uniref:type II toxin-antitoxin system RelE/ParE family toxin n=1 Tax=Acidobacteriaceae bacterium ZG23-2 TaxID=2883246 RepID=UPI00406D1FF6